MQFCVFWYIFIHYIFSTVFCIVYFLSFLLYRPQGRKAGTLWRSPAAAPEDLLQLRQQLRTAEHQQQPTARRKEGRKARKDRRHEQLQRISVTTRDAGRDGRKDRRPARETTRRRDEKTGGHLQQIRPAFHHWTRARLPTTPAPAPVKLP